MINTFKIKDTVEDLYVQDIKDDCIVFKTHLISIIQVSWANLFEKKEDEAITYMRSLFNAINELNFPIQLITQNRKKNFNNHINEIKKRIGENNYYLKFKKDKEWFEEYFKYELKSWRISEKEIEKKYEESPEYIERDMMNSYIERLNTNIENNNILEKVYYFVISTLDQPEDTRESSQEINIKDTIDSESEYEKQKEKLEKRIKHTLNILSDFTGMLVERKKTNELINIVFDYFNFPLSTKHHINEERTIYGEVPNMLIDTKWWNYKEEKNIFLSLWELVVNSLWDQMSWKDTGLENKNSNSVKQLIKPSYIDDSNMWYVQINDSYNFTIHIHKFGSEYLEDLVLWEILTLPYFFDISIQINQVHRWSTMLEIKKEKERIKANFEAKKEKKSRDFIAKIKDEHEREIAELNEFESNLENKRTGIFSVSTDITFRANSLDELKKIKETVKDKLSTKWIFFGQATGNHLSGFISTAPFLINLISWTRKLFAKEGRHLSQLYHYYPYCPDAIQLSNGLMLGIGKQWYWESEIRNLEFFDYFDRSRIINSIIAIIGNSWSGKTTFAHQLFRTQELLWYKHLILDYLGNYIRWAEDMPEKYEVIKIDPSSSHRINPCDVVIPSGDTIKTSEDYKWKSIEEIKEKIINNKISELSAYYEMFLEDEYNPKTIWLLDKKTKEVYVKKFKDIDITKIEFLRDVFLSDIVKELQKEKDPETKKLASEIATMLEPYSSWSSAWMFNSPTNVNIDHNKSFVFYLRWNKTSRYEELATLQSFSITQQIIRKRKNNILAIDELHKIFRMESKEIQNFFRSQIAMIRNLDGWVLWMTQLLQQIITNVAWKEFLELATTKLYLSGWFSSWDNENSLLKYEKSFSNASKNYLLSNNRPWYWILMIDGEQKQIKIDNHADMSLFERYKPPKE